LGWFLLAEAAGRSRVLTEGNLGRGLLGLLLEHTSLGPSDAFDRLENRLRQLVAALGGLGCELLERWGDLAKAGVLLGTLTRVGGQLLLHEALLNRGDLAADLSLEVLQQWRPFGLKDQRDELLQPRDGVVLDLLSPLLLDLGVTEVGSVRTGLRLRLRGLLPLHPRRAEALRSLLGGEALHAGVQRLLRELGVLRLRLLRRLLRLRGLLLRLALSRLALLLLAKLISLVENLVESGAWNELLSIFLGWCCGSVGATFPALRALLASS